MQSDLDHTLPSIPGSWKSGAAAPKSQIGVWANTKLWSRNEGVCMMGLSITAGPVQVFCVFLEINWVKIRYICYI
jgi:hypothetical protein